MTVPGMAVSGDDCIRVGPNNTRQWVHPPREDDDGKGIDQLAVTNSRILMAAPTLNSILIYNYDGQEERGVRLQEMEQPQYICCSDNHSIIVSSRHQS